MNLAQALQVQSAEAVLCRLRGTSGVELRRELERTDPTVMLRLTGAQGYQAKRFLIMREDVLPLAWDDYVRHNAAELFAHGLESDVILQRLLAWRMRSDQCGSVSHALKK